MFIDSGFKPAWWLPGPHAQTIYAGKLRRIQPVHLHRERIELPDGDFVDAALANLARDTVTCVFHGLGGGANSAYASGVCGALLQHGYGVAFMHFRGCSGEPNRRRITYHSGHTDDIAYFIEQLRARIPAQSRLAAVAYSLGANALLKYLGEQQDQCPLDYAIAISPPLVLSDGANRIRQGFSRVYQRYLLKAMRAQHQQRREKHPEFDLPEDTGQWRDFWDFDDAVTAPLNGFADVHDYYEKASSRPYLKKISVPTHIVHALDDPFFTRAVIPEPAELSPQITFELSQTGGHVGFVSGNNPMRPQYWLDQRVTGLLGKLPTG